MYITNKEKRHIQIKGYIELFQDLDNVHDGKDL